MSSQQSLIFLGQNGGGGKTETARAREICQLNGTEAYAKCMKLRSNTEFCEQLICSLFFGAYCLSYARVSTGSAERARTSCWQENVKATFSRLWKLASLLANDFANDAWLGNLQKTITGAWWGIWAEIPLHTLTQTRHIYACTERGSLIPSVHTCLKPRTCVIHQNQVASAIFDGVRAAKVLSMKYS